jgi:hypothetical protein
MVCTCKETRSKLSNAHGVYHMGLCTHKSKRSTSDWVIFAAMGVAVQRDMLRSVLLNVRAHNLTPQHKRAVGCCCKEGTATKPWESAAAYKQLQANPREQQLCYASAHCMPSLSSLEQSAFDYLARSTHAGAVAAESHRLGEKNPYPCQQSLPVKPKIIPNTLLQSCSSHHQATIIQQMRAVRMHNARSQLTQLHNSCRMHVILIAESVHVFAKHPYVRAV